MAHGPTFFPLDATESYVSPVDATEGYAGAPRRGRAELRARNRQPAGLGYCAMVKGGSPIPAPAC